MYLNQFASDLAPLDMTATDEFASLCQSADDLKIAYRLPVRYQSRNIVVNGLRIHYLEWGDDSMPPVVMCHGGHQSGHSWDIVNLVLGSKFHVYALDQRGHGDSEHPRDHVMGTQAMSDDLVAFIRALGIQRPMIFGHSMGGIVTMYTLVQNPGLASKAVIVDIGPETAAAGSATIRNFVRNNTEFDSVDKFIENVHQYDPFRSVEHIKRSMKYNLLERADGKYVSKVIVQPDNIRTGARPSIEDVRQIACPVLLTRGADSNVLTPEAAVRFQAALPDGRLVTVPNCGHNVHSQNTQGFLDAVLPFVGF